MATIRLEDVCRIFPRSAAHDEPVAALDHLNLTIPNGKTLAIIGPSGCGKSTLLRLIAGLDSHYTGHIYFDGQDMATEPTKARGIGMVFQTYALYPNLLGRGNLAFFFKVHKVDEQVIEERIQATARVMGLGFEQLLQYRPNQMSGGQRQRVALGRAIVRSPRLLLLDEPLSNLDAKLRNQTRTEIKRLLVKFSITTVYVTHDQTEAIALSDHIAVMRQGHIEQIGAYAELRRHPANAFVAGFVGLPPMNLLPGVQPSAGHLHLGEGASLPIPTELAGRLRQDVAVTLGLRPEFILVQPGSSGELLSSITTLEPDYAAHQQAVVFTLGAHQLKAFISTQSPLRPGDPISISFSPAELYLFREPDGKILGL